MIHTSRQLKDLTRNLAKSSGIEAHVLIRRYLMERLQERVSFSPYKDSFAEMLAEGHKANFVTFTEGTTLSEGQTAMMGAGEHMTSFDYAYKIEAVRDWLFAQEK